MKKIFFYPAALLLILLFLPACTNKNKQPLEKLSAGEIFEKFKKNVVLVKNKSFYKVTFEDNTTAYFTQVFSDDDDSAYSDLTFDENEAKQKAGYTYGTGFIINKKGVIATNLHVVAPSERLIAEVNFKKSIIFSLQDDRDNTLKKLAVKVASLRKYHPEDSAFINTAIPANLLSTMPPVKDDEIDGNFAAASLVLDTANNEVDSLVTHDKLVEDLANKDFKVTIETVDLSISLDGSTGNDVEYPCHILSLSTDKHIDLSIIQTNDEVMPLGVTEVIDVMGDGDEYGNAITSNDTLKVSTPLYLIGYNYGPEIANTTDGRKVQLTKGEVTQENDKYRVLYSIPALPGSSGSPVFNSYGKVVAIHYCGLQNNNSFNYGILSYYLRDMMNSSRNLEFPL
jgi:S1-C subfamily serine protease